MNSSSGSLARLVMVVVGLLAVGLIFALAISLTSASVLRVQLKETRAELEHLRQTRATGSPTRVEALEKLLREQSAAYAKLQDDYRALQRGDAAADDETQPAPAANTNNTATARGPGGAGGSWLERLRTEDPERYKQIQEERERRRARVDAYFDEQFDRLDQRYATATSPDEVNLVGQIAETLGKIDELRQQWQQLRELPEDERRAQAQQLAGASRETYQRLAELRTLDRDLQLNQLASQLGYGGGDSAQFVDRVKGIITETETNPMSFMGWRGGRGDGGRSESR